MMVLGFDIGSRAVKLVSFYEGVFQKSLIFDTFDFYRNYCTYMEGKIFVDFEKLDIGKADRIVSTGYGRNNININGSETITEIKAHTFGAIGQTGLKEFTLLDVGGQDSKVVHIKNKRIMDMILNDKCAASCGRYLENMAKVIGLSVGEIAGYSQNPAELSSTCAVFAESELIGKISEGYTAEVLAASINYSLFKRIKPLIERFPAESVVVTGGVAANNALLEFIKAETDFKEVIVPQYPQLNGAIGCCVYALDK
ncbi:MAG TPA: acyl-CoA dehydratase activase [Pseudobacteroides sp.]|uniref:acyl-CoA dehydratase activase n=1 Tax=Pseudobacteroides sp. TaxID=1968840 RepID=UPI002F92FCB4